ncbi:hypothetical protein KC726_03875 [Candidatus Woesebacteria bacterium]|nr:hypothetical protein [Candidatus Woesebacteria bacterium]
MLKTIPEILDYMDAFVHEATSAEYMLLRAKDLLNRLGNPQRQLRVVHVAGTSAKGSTVFYTAALLHAHGYTVGSSISPHLVHLQERVKINNAPIADDLFISYFNELVPTIEDMKRSSFGSPSFFEIMMALAFYVFYKEHVDFAVIETGMGGRYDASNTVDRDDKIAVITKIGFDHMKFLGNTLPKIGNEKIHIVKDHNLALSMAQKPQVEALFKAHARKHQTTIRFIKEGEAYVIRKQEQGVITFDFHYNDCQFDGLKLCSLARYNVENVSIALAACYEALKREKKSLDRRAVQRVLQHDHLPGRFQEVLINGNKIILDSAHNPQKMATFIHDLTRVYPDTTFRFILAFKKGKRYKKMLEYIFPLASEIVLSQFEGENQGMRLVSSDSFKLEQELNEMGFSKTKTIKLDQIYSFLQQKTKEVTIITGSMYFVGDVLRMLYETS